MLRERSGDTSAFDAATAGVKEDVVLSVQQLADATVDSRCDSDADFAVLLYKLALAKEVVSMRADVCKQLAELSGKSDVWLYQQLYSKYAKCGELVVLAAIRRACGPNSGGKTGKHPLYRALKWLVSQASGEAGGGCLLRPFTPLVLPCLPTLHHLSFLPLFLSDLQVLLLLLPLTLFTSSWLARLTALTLCCCGSHYWWRKDVSGVKQVVDGLLVRVCACARAHAGWFCD